MDQQYNNLKIAAGRNIKAIKELVLTAKTYDIDESAKETETSLFEDI